MPEHFQGCLLVASPERSGEVRVIKEYLQSI